MIQQGSRADAILAALQAEIERHRTALDGERGLERVVFEIKFGRTGEPLFIQYRPLIERCLTKP